MQETRSSLQTFGREIVKIGGKNENVAVVVADSMHLMSTEVFKNTFPARHLNLGVAEQNVIGVAAGLASRGKLPYVCMPVMKMMRAWEQIRNLVCVPNLNVKFIASYGGIGHGRGGIIKQCFEDVALMRSLPKMKVFVPMDSYETKAMCEVLINDFGPTYVRLSDVEYLFDPNEGKLFDPGVSHIVHSGRDVLMVANGDMVFLAMKAAKVLEEKGISVVVVNASSVKPLDEKLLSQYARKAQMVVAIEEHAVNGGLGDAISSLFADGEIFKRVYRIAVDNSFGESCCREDSCTMYGLDVDLVVNKVSKWWKSLA